jgi:transposase
MRLPRVFSYKKHTPIFNSTNMGVLTKFPQCRAIVDKKGIYMYTKSSKLNQKNLLNSYNASSSQGKPIYSANLWIDKSIVKIEVLNQNNVKREFKNTPENIQSILSIFLTEDVKGVRLSGNRRERDLLAVTLLQNKIRPLISDFNDSRAIKGFSVIKEHVAGIDIGKTIIYVSISPDLDEYHTRAFGTFTDDLESLVSWLKEHNIQEVAMESTSIFWQPLFAICEKNGIIPLLVNPKKVKMLPGRKTDVLDSQWLRRLLSCGLLEGAFIPSQQICEMRDMARHRQDLMERSATCLNLIHKMLAQMNLQLSNVLSDISGKSGMNIIRAIIKGERDPNILATLIDKRCRCSEEEVARALKGTYNESLIFMMKNDLEIYEKINEMIIKEELKIKELLERLPDKPNPPPSSANPKRQRKKAEYNRSPYSFDMRGLLRKKFGYDLTVLIGIDDSIAATIIFETGGNVDAFPTKKHFASWNATCPGNKKSGAKELSGKGPKKFSRVGQALRIAANSNYHADSATGAYLRRLQRKGKCKKVARKASAHKISDQVYNMMKFGQIYVEKGAAEYEKAYKERKVKAMMKELRELGFDVVKKVA